MKQSRVPNTSPFHGPRQKPPCKALIPAAAWNYSCLPALRKEPFHSGYHSPQSRDVQSLVHDERSSCEQRIQKRLEWETVTSKQRSEHISTVGSAPSPGHAVTTVSPFHTPASLTFIHWLDIYLDYEGLQLSLLPVAI